MQKTGYYSIEKQTHTTFMDEDLTMLIIISLLLVLLGFTIWSNRSEQSEGLIADMAKVAISGYLGYLHGKDNDKT